MPRKLYNEGRVVGYSAYEMYVKHTLAVDPDHEPASEKEWLASMMAMGSSMLLKVESDSIGSQYDVMHYRDVQFPESSRLCAANTIMASLFIGEGAVSNNSPWCTKVIDYGPLMKNDSISSPNGTVKYNGYVSPVNINNIDDKSIAPKIKEYIKIVDGIIIQPGTWVENINKPPQKDFKPTLSEYPRLRIAFSERINEPFFLLLTGFTNRTVVDGVTGFDTAVNTLSPQDGDFLGPWAFPWSNKIIFSMPTAFVNYFMNNKYSRKLKKDTPEIEVKSDVIIDLKQNHDKNNKSDYYENDDNQSRITAEVTDLNVFNEDTAILTTYMHSNENTKLPPALYAALINNTGLQSFEPVDSMAPGSLHLYHGKLYNDELLDSSSIPYKKSITLEQEAIGAKAFIKSDSDDVVFEFSETVKDPQNSKIPDIVPVSNDETKNQQYLKMNNLPYIWFIPNYDSDKKAYIYDKLDTILVNKFIHGVLSDTFIKEYCFSAKEIEELSKAGTPACPVSGKDTLNLNTAQLYSTYNTITETERNNYNYALIGNHSQESSISAQYRFIPIENKSNLISLIIPTSVNITSGTGVKSIDFTDKLDYIGSWWNGSEAASKKEDLCNFDQLIDHPRQSKAILIESIFYQPNAAVPKPTDSKFGIDFLKWFKNTNVTDMIPDSKFASYNIHSKYKNLSIYKFLLYCCTRNISKDYNDESSYLAENSSALTYTQYFYKKSTIENLRVNSPVKNQQGNNDYPFVSGHELNADMKIQCNFSNKHFFYDAPVSLINISNGKNVTKNYTSNDNPIWTSVGTSGLNSTTAISLIDGDGVMLSRLGTSSTLDIDKIIWEDLLVALNSDQTLDILGDILREWKKCLKSCGENYFELVGEDSPRVYFSNSEPKGDIPDGSIGIGW